MCSNRSVVIPRATEFPVTNNRNVPLSQSVWAGAQGARRVTGEEFAISTSGYTFPVLSSHSPPGQNRGRPRLKFDTFVRRVVNVVVQTVISEYEFSLRVPDNQVRITTGRNGSLPREQAVHLRWSRGRNRNERMGIDPTF